MAKTKIPVELIIEAVAVSGDKFKAMVLARSADPENFAIKGRIEIIGLKKNQKEIIEHLTTHKKFELS